MRVVLVRNDGVELNLGHCTSVDVKDASSDAHRRLTLARAESLGIVPLTDVKEVRIKL